MAGNWSKGTRGTVKSKAAAGCTDGKQEVGSPGTEEGEVSHRGPRRFPEPPRKNSRRWLPVGAGPPGSMAVPRSFPHGIITASLLTSGRGSAQGHCFQQSQIGQGCPEQRQHIHALLGQGQDSRCASERPGCFQMLRTPAWTITKHPGTDGQYFS